jgi:hypothetical protein
VIYFAVFVAVVAFVLYRWKFTDTEMLDWGDYLPLYFIGVVAFIIWLEPRIG